MKTLMLLVGLLMTWEHGQVLGAPAVSEQELQEMSTEGSKYVNKEIKNAFKEVKHIKSPCTTLSSWRPWPRKPCWSIARTPRRNEV
uniref:Clusterin n=1 Tax=Pipistrellus kuhlii TaxID=59472 RepID=A0A7J7X9N0_PIPKU|nr:clusterin [Pipistrellus kuhlii]